MRKIALTIVFLIAVLHLYIAWLEIFAWTTRGPLVFSTLANELFEPTKALAANQGLYNSFLAFGLLWSMLITDERWSKNVATCFLLFVAIAGVFGAFTVAYKIALIQTLPAMIALTLLWLTGSKRN